MHHIYAADKLSADNVLFWLNQKCIFNWAVRWWYETKLLPFTYRVQHLHTPLPQMRYVPLKLQGSRLWPNGRLLWPFFDTVWEICMCATWKFGSVFVLFVFLNVENEWGRESVSVGLWLGSHSVWVHVGKNSWERLWSTWWSRNSGIVGYKVFCKCCSDLSSSVRGGFLSREMPAGAPQPGWGRGRLWGELMSGATVLNEGLIF